MPRSSQAGGADGSGHALAGPEERQPAQRSSPGSLDADTGGAGLGDRALPAYDAARNFRRLVLGCMDSYDSERRRIFLHVSQATIFASFCTFLIA